MKARKEHRVVFYSPGTFVQEETERPIESWDTKIATQMAVSITERYGAKPYGFVFSTVVTAGAVPDGFGGELEVRPRQLEASGTHFINGRVRTIDDVRREEPDSILLSNMECNRWPLVVETRNSYRHVAVFEEGHTIVDSDGTITDRGDSEKWRAYRTERIAELNRERGV